MSKPISVLIVDTSPVIGGAELYALELARRLPGGKYRVFVASAVDFCAGGVVEKIVFRSDRIKTCNVFKAISSLRSSLIDLLKIIETHDPDIIQSNNVRAHLLGALAALIKKRPLIWVNHSYDFPVVMYKLLSIIPAKIVHVSRTIEKDYLPLVRKDRQIRVIYNGIEARPTNPGVSVQDLRSRYGLRPFDKAIGVIGRIEKYKGQEHFVKSMPLVMREIPDVKFIIAGDPGPKATWYFKYLKRLIIDLKLEDKVYFTGFVENIFELISCLDVVIQPSIKPESFGRTIVESMLMGKPVIASNIGGFSEIISDGRDGILFPPGNHQALASVIIRLLRDEQTAKTIGDTGKRKVTDAYTIANMVAGFEELYGEVMCNENGFISVDE